MSPQRKKNLHKGNNVVAPGHYHNLKPRVWEPKLQVACQPRQVSSIKPKLQEQAKPSKASKLHKRPNELEVQTKLKVQAKQTIPSSKSKQSQARQASYTSAQANPRPNTTMQGGEASPSQNLTTHKDVDVMTWRGKHTQTTATSSKEPRAMSKPKPSPNEHGVRASQQEVRANKQNKMSAVTNTYKEQGWR